MTVCSFGKKIPKIHESAWVHPAAEIIGKVEIGPRVYIGAGAILRGDVGKIMIAEGSAILENVILQVSPSKKITIGKNSTISVGAILHNCIVHDDVMIGMGAIISDDVELSKGVVVGEGSVVRGKINTSDYDILAGVPAKVVGKVSDSKKEFFKTIPEIYQSLTKKYKVKLKELTPDEYIWKD